MTLGIYALICFLLVFTSFLSGVFGMAGGMVLMGALLMLMPVASAMVLQSIAQLVSNAWRAFMWHRHTDWRIVVRCASGAMVAFLLFLSIQLVPSRGVVLLVMGLSPFVALALPARIVPQATSRGGAEACGFISQMMQLLSGVSGPVLDVFFVRSTQMDRRAVVATKATVQSVHHALKLVYFGGIMGVGSVDLHWLQWALMIGFSILGTSLSRLVLERISDVQFRRWTRVIVLAVGSVYIVQGIYTFL